MRVFVAIFPPPNVQEKLALHRNLVAERANVRWVPAENIHLTLKFLGDVPEDNLEEINLVLSTIAGRHEPFMVRHRGLSGFPTQKKARILWVGVEKGSANLSSLARDLDDSLGSIGFAPEKKPHVAHATIGRVRKGSLNLRGEIREMSGEVPEFSAWRLNLVQSSLGAGGASYSVLKSHPMGRTL